MRCTARPAQQPSAHRFRLSELVPTYSYAPGKCCPAGEASQHAAERDSACGVPSACNAQGQHQHVNSISSKAGGLPGPSGPADIGDHTLAVGGITALQQQQVLVLPSSVLKVLVLYMQYMVIKCTMPVEWPITILAPFQALAALWNGNSSEALAVECLVPSWRQPLTAAAAPGHPAASCRFPSLH